MWGTASPPQRPGVWGRRRLAKGRPRRQTKGEALPSKSPTKAGSGASAARQRQAATADQRRSLAIPLLLAKLPPPPHLQQFFLRPPKHLLPPRQNSVKTVSKHRLDASLPAIWTTTPAHHHSPSTPQLQRLLLHPFQRHPPISLTRTRFSLKSCCR